METGISAAVLRTWMRQEIGRLFLLRLNVLWEAGSQKIGAAYH
jgi:hypothetical protein